MSRWTMVADLRRCVGCQTCTAACKVANGTTPWVQWRWVVDFEIGEFPDVWRAFVPVGCQHCEEPPCVAACPTGATWKRDDGIVVTDYDRCMGCSYCAIACPYQARYKVQEQSYAYGEPMQSEMETYDPERIGVTTKCTFCIERIDSGIAKGLQPGVDPEATPVCVNSCIADALYFGDIQDPQSKVSRLLEENESFRMHDELGTKPAFYYLWEQSTK